MKRGHIGVNRSVAVFRNRRGSQEWKERRGCCLWIHGHFLKANFSNGHFLENLISESDSSKMFFRIKFLENFMYFDFAEQ